MEGQDRPGGSRMSNRTIAMTDPLYDYLLASSLREDNTLRALREETMKRPMAQMQISPEQGQFLAFLVSMLGARKIIEIGTFTGYSALWMAMGGGPSCRITACDVSEEWTTIAQRYWQLGGVRDRIELRLQDARLTLEELLQTPDTPGSYDFAFIDADKSGYPFYYERCVELIRPGGVIAVDNMLWAGRVADATVDDKDTKTIRRLTLQMRDDPRVDFSLVPIGDGMALARKK